ncbi:ParM/StbA family protein [Diaphorobacter sp. J5-51]|uniref:ParM/StbA family protein n=1 Tax=Diaphorobacter sp. J5-51 TaxID=680496 RepID=UPI001F328FD3|nr:ParM/StbA family protein [Diaphorobacter sp. J5-51]
MMNILGIDIGYSNLKIAYGSTDGDVTTALRPAGAAPSDRFGSRFDGRAQDDFLHVLVDDQPFIAGVSSDRAEMWERSLHADYSKTPSYKALMHAGMLMSGMNEIDVLVTGLPVSQFNDPAKRAELEKKFVGKHQITPKRSVNVNQVKVLAQPVGGLLDYIEQQDEEKTGFLVDDDARVLVVDPGFFSLDWVLVSNGQLQRQSSGTSLKASSVLLEQAARFIAEDYGATPSTESLENAVRNNKSSILIMGQRVQIELYIKKASEAMASVTADAIQKSLRIESVSPDVVVMVGGGATFFEKAVREAFSKLKVVMPKDPVFSPARGFWLMGAYA